MRHLFGRDSAAVLLTVALVGCGGGGDAGGGGGGGGGGAATPAASPVDAATAGNIAGMVMFDGAAPGMDAIDMADETACAEKYSSQPMTEEVVVGDGGGLANVFVYVKEGLDAALDFSPPAAVVMDQDGCRYIPHVIGVQAGQDITFRNSDGLLHNINASPSENRGFNVSQPVNMDTNRNFAVAEVMVPVRCDVHGWMSAYIGVLDHPFHSVTGPDGRIDLSTLPPGDYVVEAWHERYGTQTANVTVATGQTADVSFTFNEAMAAGAVVPLGDPIDPHDHGTAVATDRSAGDTQ